MWLGKSAQGAVCVCVITSFTDKAEFSLYVLLCV